MTREELEEHILELARIHAATHDEAVKTKLEKLRKRIRRWKSGYVTLGRLSLSIHSLHNCSPCSSASFLLWKAGPSSCCTSMIEPTLVRIEIVPREHKSSRAGFVTNVQPEIR